MQDNWLKYQELPANDGFVENVMQGVRRERRIRRLVLVLSGLVGAAFGIAGAVILSDSITRLVLQVFEQAGAGVAGLALMLVLAFLAWLLNDEATLV